MIVRIRHATKCHYALSADAGAHVLHLRPRDLPHQRVHGFALRISAGAARLAQGTDHFGNAVTRLFLDHSHDQLELTAESAVEVLPRAPVPPPELTPAWERVGPLAQLGPTALEAAEFGFASPMTPTTAEVRDWAAASFLPGRPVLAALNDLVGRMARELRVQPGSTTISTGVGRVLQLRAGSCQDLAHLMIAGLRSLRLPARYVSGYLRTEPPPGTTRLRRADQLHAWVGCWLGPEFGWIDLDPTSGRAVGQSHVCLAWGRDYADVAPVHGVLLGGGEHTMSVSVEMELAATPLPVDGLPAVSAAR